MRWDGGHGELGIDGHDPTQHYMQLPLTDNCFARNVWQKTLARLKLATLCGNLQG